jgi:hypothetical protein
LGGNGTQLVSLSLEEVEKFRVAVNMALGANMKRMLVVNDMCHPETRGLMRESILNEINNSMRFIETYLRRLCTLDLSSGSSGRVLP